MCIAAHFEPAAAPNRYGLSEINPMQFISLSMLTSGE